LVEFRERSACPAEGLAAVRRSGTVTAMRSVVLGIIVIESLIGGLNDAGRRTTTA
jgi:hypothetical protein